uniref:G-protein coupled receptors family 1 profile domain-containing protein n=1 Tax=Wuchereria bancrofti TaxID=6293 RepID=A0AAF5RWI5_WUCBA
MAIVCCSRGNLYSRAFILITFQIIICNLISFTPHMIVVLPEILLNKNSSYSHKIWINRMSSTINTSSFYAVLHFAFLWTLNRFLSIIFPKFSVLFETAKLYLLIIFVWITVFAISFLDFYYCSRSFEVSTLQWTEDCTKQSSNDGKVFLSFRHIWAIFLSLAMLVMYFAILCTIRHRRTLVINDSRTMNTGHGTNKLETAKYERSVLIQAILTCGVFMVGMLLINFLPKLLIKIFGQKTLIPVNIFINSFLILGRSVLPMTLFATNKRARKQLYLLLNIDKVD